MERTPEIFEKIEAYLSQSLPKDELLKFEAEIAKNIELQNEIEKHKSLHEVLGDKDTLAFKEKLTDISKKIKEEKTTSSFFSAKWKVAATIIVVVGIGSFLWYTSTVQNKALDLYASYYEPFPVEDVTRGESNTKFKQVIKNYNNQEYSEVIIALENIANLKDEFTLYLGNSYIKTDQEQKAIVQFEKIQKNSKYYENSRWYLALTNLKLGKIKKTISLLEEIIGYNGIYKSSALSLKEALQE